MHLKGPIIDSKIYVKPSNKLLKYLKEIPLKETMPENIKKIIQGVKYECSKVAHDKEINAKMYLTIDENENMKKIIAEYKENCKDNEEEQNGGVMTPNTENGINIKESKDIEKENETTKVMKPKDEDKIKAHKSGQQNDEEINVNEKSEKQTELSKKRSDVSLTICDLDWLFDHLLQLRQSGAKGYPYLHELLEGCNILTPENEMMKRNPELEARCVKLRAQQEAREYRAMTKGVDNVRIRFPEDSISYQLKQLNRQLIAVGQFLLSIFAGFLFGFTGIELMIGGIDFGFRLLLGVMCALIIALAEIYFLAKKLNEELSIPETTQLGGPPKFANHPTQINPTKEHQD